MYLRPISAASWLAGPIMTPSLIMATTSVGVIVLRKNLLFALHAARMLERASCMRGSFTELPHPHDPQRKRHIARTPFGKRNARNLQIGTRIGQCVLVFQLEPQYQFAIRIQRPHIGLLQIFVLRNPPDSSRGGNTVDSSAPLFQSVHADALLVNGKADGFDKSPHRARVLRMRQQHAVHTRRQHLIKHPRVPRTDALSNPFTGTLTMTAGV